MYTIQDLKQGDKFQHNDIVITITYQGNVGDALVFINNYNNVDIRTLQEINDNYTKLEEGHDGLPKLIQGFEVGDYSSKPLLLEVSADGEFNDGIFESIIRIKDSIEPFIDIDGYSWKFARKIDTSKYII